METTANDNRREPRTGEEVHQVPEADLLTGVVGVFAAPHAANQAFEVLLKLGYRPDEVGILIAEETKRRFYLPSLLTHPAESDGGSGGPADDTTPEGKAKARQDEAPEMRAMLQGAGAVSAVGALGGLLIAGAAAVVVPGLGLLMLGPLAGLGAGFGALVGGVYGVPAMEIVRAKMATRFESEVRAGKVLIQVTPRNGEDEVHIRREWDRIQGVTA